MADDDPFADLGEALEDEPADEKESDVSATGGARARESAETRDPVIDSAFSYEAAQQRPFYAREETIGNFDSWMKYELERELSQRGYQNIVVRELTDALLRTVVEEDLIQDVAERFEEARRSASEESGE
jgi:hypothetical protein